MNIIFPIFFSTISLSRSSNLTASGKIKLNAVNCKNIANMFQILLKFEYGVTNGECVDKKKFGEQNLKKRQIVRRVLHTWHTAKFLFAVCLPQAHGKQDFAVCPSAGTRQTLTAGCGRSCGVSFCRVSCFCRELLTLKF